MGAQGWAGTALGLTIWWNCVLPARN